MTRMTRIKTETPAFHPRFSPIHAEADFGIGGERGSLFDRSWPWNPHPGPLPSDGRGGYPTQKLTLAWSDSSRVAPHSLSHPMGEGRSETWPTLQAASAEPTNLQKEGSSITVRHSISHESFLAPLANPAPA